MHGSEKTLNRLLMVDYILQLNMNTIETKYINIYFIYIDENTVYI